MTYFDTAVVGRASRWLGRATLAIAMGFALAGCETAGGLFGSSSSGDTDAPPASVAVAPPAVRARIALAPVIGAPDTVSKQLMQQVTASIERQRIVVVKSTGEPSDYILRGYIVASKDRSSIKVSYIWDVTDPGGKRVNRITGEELVAGGTSRDAWSVVGPSLTQTIADKTASSLSSWLPASGPAIAGRAGSPPSAGAAPADTPSPAVASSESPPVRPAALTPGAASPDSSTGSIARSGAVPITPVVTGAPGDGNTALASALARELTSSGVALTDAKGVPLRVEGRVIVGAPKDGKQPITIDWRVRDTEGRALGTVSQKNEIPQGSLDGEWGRTADAAAAAAAQGIIKLVPTRSAAN